MTFLQSLVYLNSFFDLEKVRALPPSRRWKLERMRRLLELFGNPQRSFSTVLIVGTKGKGSTGFFLQSILNTAGIDTGFYSSPHLETPRERIRIRGKIISKKLWVKLLKRIRTGLAQGQRNAGVRAYRKLLETVTYFEVMTLMAALAFKEEGIRAGVFEAGMGGRLDATNALGSKRIIVTPIGLDHQEFLGNTISAIAREKAAVIHAGADVIVAPQDPGALRVIRARAHRMKARLWPVVRKVPFETGLGGEYQRWNAAAAVKAAEVFFSGKLKIVPSVLRKGLAAADWPGRFEIFHGRPNVILDGAHNPMAAAALVRALKVRKFEGPCVLVFGSAHDKDSGAMLRELAGYFDRVVLMPLSAVRAKSLPELMPQARPLFAIQIPARNMREALHSAACLAGPHGWIVVTGSFYLVAEARPLVRNRSF